MKGSKMEYTLKINENGQLNGWQEVHYYLNGSSLRDCQKFSDGKFQEWSGMVCVFQCGMNYSFMLSDWGSMETARDAAEDFTLPSNYPYIQVKNEAGGWDVRPFTEEAIIG